jgi:hypothetical protein
VDDLLVTEPVTIVGPGGSLARASRSLAAPHVALDGATDAGASTKLLSLGELDLPMYNPVTMEFAVRALRGWAVPYVIPVASAFRVFDSDGRVTDEGIELQLRTLGAEVVRVATRFANHATPQRARECEESAERVAASAISTTRRP